MSGVIDTTVKATPDNKRTRDTALGGVGRGVGKVETKRKKVIGIVAAHTKVLRAHIIPADVLA